MKEININLPKGKGFYVELIDKYENYTHSLFPNLNEICYLDTSMTIELLRHIQNLINEENIEYEDKLWLIKQYLVKTKLKKFD